jgi:hypothetical protein
MINLEDAKKPFVFDIKKCDITNAVQKDKNNCVIAQAIKRTRNVVAIEVGSTIIRVKTNDGKITRYQTPLPLHEALLIYDEVKIWMLPLGKYRLHPPCYSNSLETIHKEHAVRAAKGNRLNKAKYNRRTGRNTPKRLNSRVIEFAKMRLERAKPNEDVDRKTTVQ